MPDFQLTLRRMSDSENPIHDALTRFALNLNEKGLPCLVIGGNAAIHYGVPRFTRDIDLLIPESAVNQWETHMTQSGHTKIHSNNAFLQYDPPNIQSPPIDFMIVTDSTWSKLFADATELPLSNTTLKTPSALHLICLKLHATQSPHRRDTSVDWQDIESIARQNGIDPTDPKTAELLNQYGGETAATSLHQLLTTPQQ